MIIFNIDKKITAGRLLIIPFLAFLISCENNLNCDIYKNGEYISQVGSDLRTWSLIERNDSLQIEYFAGDTVYNRVKWVDNCTYLLIGDSNTFRVDITDVTKIGYEFIIDLDGATKSRPMKGTARKI